MSKTREDRIPQGGMRTFPSPPAAVLDNTAAEPPSEKDTDTQSEDSSEEGVKKGPSEREPDS